MELPRVMNCREAGDSTERVDITEALQTLAEMDAMNALNGEVCREIGRLTERCRNLESILRTAEAELCKRDCLIQRVLCNSRHLEAQLNGEIPVDSSEEMDKLNDSIEELKVRLAESQRDFEHLERQMILKAKSTGKPVMKDKEMLMRELEKSLVRDIDVLKCRLDENNELNERLVEEIECLDKQCVEACSEVEAKVEEYRTLMDEWEVNQESVSVDEEQYRLLESGDE